MTASDVGYVFLCLFALAACSRSPEFNEQQSSAVAESPAGSMYLDEARMVDMQTRARNGDVDAMRAIAAHYDFGVSDPDKAIPWLEMAVNHGSAAAMRGLAIHLAVKGGEKNCRHAEELFLRALRESKDVKEKEKIRTSYEHFRQGVGAGRCNKRS